MHTKLSLFALVLAVSISPAAADTGILGGWAADPADCAFVSDRTGVTHNVTAGIITPDNFFYYDGECYFTDVTQDSNGRLTLQGTCDEGDGEFEAQLVTQQSGPNQMRAAWDDSGWTTYHRCWDLPSDWRERVSAAQN